MGQNVKTLKNNSGGGRRNSNLELFRIITMIIIVAHHYVVNSGLMDLVVKNISLGTNDIFLLLFGWGGKTGINCFVLITGYFMCSSQITKRKFGKLLGEIYFYSILFFVIFLLTGYSTFSIKGFLKMIFPFFTVKDNFVSCFLLFYLFIPFINKLLHALTEKEHMLLVALCLFVYTILPSFAKATVTFNYVTWFIVLYIISAYIRLYPKKVFDSTRLWGALASVSVLLSYGSVIILAWLGRKIGKPGIEYFFVSDSNKVLAIITAVCAFMFFKNLKIWQSKVINTVGASTFGVLLIHANSDAMRQWLWHDTLKNVSYYNSPILIVHAIGSVAAVFIICTIIDQLRIRLIETPLRRRLEKR